MIWFFERAAERLRYEIRRDNVGAGFELVVTNPDGSERLERFADAGRLIARSVDLERGLTDQGWRPPQEPARPRLPPRDEPAGNDPEPADRALVPHRSPARRPTLAGAGREAQERWWRGDGE